MIYHISDVARSREKRRVPSGDQEKTERKKRKGKKRTSGIIYFVKFKCVIDNGRLYSEFYVQQACNLNSGKKIKGSIETH